MDIKVAEAKVLLTDGQDIVSLKTDLPCPYVKTFLPTQPLLELEFKATFDTGIEYCQKHFGIDPKVVDIRRIWWNRFKNY